jgi:RNA polymerase sigma-70 factor, ECF subfamily
VNYALELSPEKLAVWIRQARQGDRDAMEQILAAHEQPVLRVALRMLGRLEDAQDAAQDVFLRLYRSLDQFDDTRQLRPWLYRITVNVCLDILRRRRQHLELIDNRSEPPSAEQSLLLEERQSAIEWALPRLAPRERAALLLREVEGLSTREVAEALEIEETTVRSLIYQARGHLRDWVRQYPRRRR